MTHSSADTQIKHKLLQHRMFVDHYKLSMGTYSLLLASSLWSEIPGKNKRSSFEQRQNEALLKQPSHKTCPHFKEEHTDTQTPWCSHRQISGLFLISWLCLCDWVFLSMTNRMLVCVCVYEGGRGRHYIGQDQSVPDLSHKLIAEVTISVQLVQHFTTWSPR